MKKIAEKVVSTLGTGGSVLSFFLGSWGFYPAIIALILIFKDEIRIVGGCVVIVVLIIVSPDIPWSTKKRRIHYHFIFATKVIQRNIVKKFFGREVL